jgi:hypothetical protein
MDDLQEVEKWRGEAMALSQKHTIEELENKEADEQGQAGISKSQGNELQGGLN